MRKLHRRDDRGAVAVLFAILAVVLFGVAALAVDLSNGFVRKRDAQAQADFAALAGGAELTGETTAGPPAAVVDAVAEYLNRNQPQDDKGVTPVGSAQLTNGDYDDGEVEFTADGLRVVSPFAQVNFAFAGVLGLDRTTDVQADATVGIFSPGTGPMPVYAVDGCAAGPQTFTDPAGGHVVPVARPPMLHDTEPPAFNNAKLDAPLVTSPTPVSVGDIDVQISISGTALNAAGAGVVKIGFFRDKTGAEPHLVEVDPTTRTNSLLTATIPSTVTAYEGVWWVRVFKGNASAEGSWSPPEEALPLRVGQAVLECESGSSSGNFGTLDLPRTDVSSPDDQIAMNMATKLEFDLAVMPAGGPAPTCKGAGAPAVHAMDDGTNCVDTKTGLPANAVTQGLITGLSSLDVPGRLMQDTSERCRESEWGGRPTRAPSGISGYDINDDILTCFLTDTTTTIEDISKEGAAFTAGAVLHPDIYSSPRFIWVPILYVEPTEGGSDKYSIKEFRPAFITDQPTSANATNHAMGTTTTNGLYVDQPAGNRVSRMKVVFFNVEALPADAGGAPVTSWMGFGPKILRLID